MLLSPTIRGRAIIALVLCLVNLPIMTIVLCVYHTRPQLKTHFNNLIVVTIVLMTLPSLTRLASAAMLLADSSVSRLACDVFGIVEVFFTGASFTTLIAFYYSIMTLRWNPLRRVLKKVTSMDDEAIERTRGLIWFVLACVVGTAVTIVSTYLLYRDDGTTSARIGYFGYTAGFCSIPNPHNTLEWLILAIDYFVPLIILVLLGLCGYCALRFQARRIAGWTLRQSWPVYLRFFGIAAYLALLAIITVVAAAQTNNDTLAQTFAMVVTVSFSSFMSIMFLLTERMLCIKWWKESIDAENDDDTPIFGFSCCIRSLLVMELQGVADDSNLNSRSGLLPRSSMSPETGYLRQ